MSFFQKDVKEKNQENNFLMVNQLISYQGTSSYSRVYDITEVYLCINLFLITFQLFFLIKLQNKMI